jgi:hypothetical protein
LLTSANVRSGAVCVGMDEASTALDPAN